MTSIFTNNFENIIYSFSNEDTFNLVICVDDLMFILQNFIITKIGEYKCGKATKLIIKNKNFSKQDKVKVWNLTEEKININPNNHFNVDCLKELYVKNIKKDLIKKYNANTFFYYESEYEKVNNYWRNHIDNLFFLLRFFKCKFLFPQTQLISDESGNFEIELLGFKNFGVGDSIFYEEYNDFHDLINSSYNNFLDNPQGLNNLFTYWINFQIVNQFIEISVLSGFVFFEVLKKEFVNEQGEFFDKLNSFLNSYNFDLEFLNKTFGEIFYNIFKESEQDEQLNNFNNDLIKEIFDFYRKSFIIYIIVLYRNKIVHSGKLIVEDKDLIKILNKINKKLEKNYLKNHKTHINDVNDYKEEFEEINKSYQKGFKKGFYYGCKPKNGSDEYFNDKIKPALNKINNILRNNFRDLNDSLEPIIIFDNLMTLILLVLLDVDATLADYPKFNINQKYIHDSKEYISKFIKN